MNSSLRKQLLTWVLLPMVCAIGVDAWVTFRSSEATASVVQDRLLLGSARTIAQQISFEDGTFQLSIPPAALELFQSAETDRIFYRVTTGSGRLLAGYTDLPLPDATLPSDAPHFFSTTMRKSDIRVVAFFQPIIGNPSLLPVVVQVAQTTHSRTQLTYRLWFLAVGQQLLILVLASIFILYGLHRGLRPLIQLRNEVRSRKEGPLQLLQTDRIPTELMPVVEAFNDYIQRLEIFINRRSIFVQNAAHQLRTPLAVLNTQVSDALRAETKMDSHKALHGARATLKHTARLVNQFLTLSSAEAYAGKKKKLSSAEFCHIIQKVLEDLAGQAHTKDIDLGFESEGDPLEIATDPVAVREIALNVIENALRYTQHGGEVTVRVSSAEQHFTLVVEDNGPGVPVESHEKIFERFYRLENSASTGSGLGLAIVKELAVQCGGTIRIDSPHRAGRGFSLSITFAR